MGFLEPRIIQTTKRYPAPRRCGVRVPVPRPPVAVRPTLYYHGGMSRDAGGNPAWRDEGATGATGVATGLGGAANPTLIGNGYPGYSFDGGDSLAIGAGATNPTGDPVFTMGGWFLTGDINARAFVVRGNPLVASAARMLYINVNGARSLGMEFAGNRGFRSAAAIYTNGVPFHLVAKKTAAGQVSTANTFLFLNGAPLAGSPNVAFTPNAQNNSGTFGVAAGAYIVGSVFEFFDWPNVALPDSAISAIFQATRHAFGV